MHPTTNRPLTIALSLLLASAAASAQTLDTPEPGSIEAIAQETSDRRFSSSWVASVPDSAEIPSPTDFLGHIAVLQIQLVPEPNSLAMLVAGAGALVLLHRRFHGSSSLRDFSA